MGSLTDCREAMEQVFNGGLVPVVDSVYPLEQAREAYERYEQGKQFGRIVLNLWTISR